MKKILLFLAILCSLNFLCRANNVTITNVNVSGGNMTFDLSWENSWNATNGVSLLYPKNWDAVWVFLKYQQATDKLWKHLKLSSNNADHSITGGGVTLQVDAVSDSMGVFIHRTSPGAGNISNASVTLKLTNALPVDTLNFKVFGIEMVYIPQDTFQISDGVSAATRFSSLTIGSAQETSGISAGTICSSCPAVPAAFPLGYNSFYAMKYEISSEQWVNFLNTLTYDQQAERTVPAPNSAVNTSAYNATVYGTTPLIQIAIPGVNNTQPAEYGLNLDGDANFNESNDGANISVTGLNKQDLWAYLDWAALRPMSETEFEKLCRGNLPRVTDEFVWGSVNFTVGIYRASVINSGQNNEVPSASVALSNGRAVTHQPNVQNPGGAVRSGLLATGSSGREVAGAGFYGNMDLGGNVWETVVWVDAVGAAFTGNTGDGTLTVLGDANTPGWPDATLSTASGIGLRGNSYYGNQPLNTEYLKTSYRAATVNNARSFTYGGRGVR